MGGHPASSEPSVAWVQRLHLVATLHGLPIGFALTGGEADERQVLLDLLHDDPGS
jgi:hypothetical protein